MVSWISILKFEVNTCILFVCLRLFKADTGISNQCKYLFKMKHLWLIYSNYRQSTFYSDDKKTNYAGARRSMCVITFQFIVTRPSNWNAVRCTSKEMRRRQKTIVPAKKGKSTWHTPFLSLFFRMNWCEPRGVICAYKTNQHLSTNLNNLSNYCDSKTRQRRPTADNHSIMLRYLIKVGNPNASTSEADIA